MEYDKNKVKRSELSEKIARKMKEMLQSGDRHREETRYNQRAFEFDVLRRLGWLFRDVERSPSIKALLSLQAKPEFLFSPYAQGAHVSMIFLQVSACFLDETTWPSAPDVLKKIEPQLVAFFSEVIEFYGICSIDEFRTSFAHVEKQEIPLKFITDISMLFMSFEPMDVITLRNGHRLDVPEIDLHHEMTDQSKQPLESKCRPSPKQQAFIEVVNNSLCELLEEINDL